MLRGTFSDNSGPRVPLCPSQLCLLAWSLQVLVHEPDLDATYSLPSAPS